MEHNSDFLYNQVLTWLHQESTARPSSPDRMGDESSFYPDLQGQGRLPREESFFSTNAENLVDDDGADPYLELLEDPLELEEEGWTASSNFGESARPVQSFDMGEIPIVQKRFQALLKRRLQAEIERHPPLFPWETEIADYQPEYSDEVGSPPALSRTLWMPQLASLLPVAIPDNILSVLLGACAEASVSLRPEGAKTIDAVKQLFPDRVQVLNEMLERFRLSPMLAPGRFGNGDRGTQRAALAAVLPRSYETATADQQMAISLMAAREIINGLTLVLSLRQPQDERRWQTTDGLVLLQAEYCSHDGNSRSVRLRARLPKGGSLTLRSNQESSTAERTYPGSLSVELFDWEPGQTYAAEVCLCVPQQMPLQLAIACQ